jgi:hypothetical protein
LLEVVRDARFRTMQVQSRVRESDEWGQNGAEGCVWRTNTVHVQRALRVFAVLFVVVSLSLSPGQHRNSVKLEVNCYPFPTLGKNDELWVNQVKRSLGYGVKSASRSCCHQVLVQAEKHDAAHSSGNSVTYLLSCNTQVARFPAHIRQGIYHLYKC